MKRVRTDFERMSKIGHYKGTYIILAEAVKGQEYSRKTLTKAMNRFLNPDEYDKEDRKLLLDHLYKLSNPSGEVEF